MAYLTIVVFCLFQSCALSLLILLRYIFIFLSFPLPSDSAYTHRSSSKRFTQKLLYSLYTPIQFFKKCVLVCMCTRAYVHHSNRPLICVVAHCVSIYTVSLSACFNISLFRHFHSIFSSTSSSSSFCQNRKQKMFKKRTYNVMTMAKNDEIKNR